MQQETDPKLAELERCYRRIYRHIDPEILGKHQATWPDDLSGLDPAPEDESDCMFLDYYSVEGLRMALEQYGFLDRIRAKGVADPRLSLHRHKKGYDIVRIHRARSNHPLVELVAYVGPLAWESRRYVDTGERRFLHIKWLRMQNPLRRPEPGSVMLPGQDFPGLGLGREMMVLVQLICTRLDLDGVVELPERLHNAAMYFRRFRFLDPEVQGILTAILRDTREKRLSELAWGIELGSLIDLHTGKPYRWIAKEQVLARKGPALQYLNSEPYRAKALDAMQANRFRLDNKDPALAGSPNGKPKETAETPFTSRNK